MRNALAYEVVKLTKKYLGPKEVLANDCIDLCISTGEIVGIFGPNGAGKTTLVRQLAGLLRPTSGEIRLFGHDLVRKPTLAPHYSQLRAGTIRDAAFGVHGQPVYSNPGRADKRP